MALFRRILLSLGLCAAMSSAVLAADWPARPITWIVPFAAGGATDALAREIAERVSRQLRQTIVIENVAGAGGTIGAGKAAKAQPDGYTFLVGHVGYMGAAPSLYPKLPYDPVKDFMAVARFPDTPLVLLVNASSPYRTAADLISAARAQPGRVNFANAGVGSTSHLVEALLASRAGVRFTSVPYKGIAPAITDLMGGSVEAVFDQTNTAMGNVASGRLRAIAITSGTPMSQYPDARPLKDDAPIGFNPVTWYGLYAPKSTATAVVQQMHAAYSKALEDEAWKLGMAARGIQLITDAQAEPAEFARFTASEIDRWKKVIVDANIRIE